MLIYQIRLPKKQDAEAFVVFMRDEYFPAVHKGPTRVGQVLDLALLQEEPEKRSTGCRFYLHVGWGGLAMGALRLDDAKIAGRLEAFGASIKRIGSYEPVADWRGGDGAEK